MDFTNTQPTLLVVSGYRRRCQLPHSRQAASLSCRQSLFCTTILLLHIVHRALMRLWALLLHIAKIPSHRQTYGTPSMPALLAPNECLGGRIGSPFARIKQVTTVERHHQTAVEKNSYEVQGLSIRYCDGSPVGWSAGCGSCPWPEERSRMAT